MDVNKEQQREVLTSPENAIYAIVLIFDIKRISNQVIADDPAEAGYEKKSQEQEQEEEQEKENQDKGENEARSRRGRRMKKEARRRRG